MAKNKKVEISVEEKLEKALVPVEEQPYKIPNNWVWTTLDNLCSKITDGTHKTPKYIDSGVPFVSVKDIYDNQIHLNNTKFISQEEHEELYKRCNPEYDDILLTKSGTIGRTAVIKTKNEFSLFVSVALLKNYKNVIDSSYLSLNIQDFFNKINISQTIKGGVIKNYHISDMKEQLIPLAPLKEQKRIVKKLDFLFDKTKKAKEIIEEIKIDIENRKISILDRAFKGVLTSKWRNENKTSDVRELLKSINDEKIKKWEEDCLQAKKDGSKKPKKPIIRKVEDMIVPVEEQAYKIPDSWVWVRLDNLCEVKGGKRIPKGEEFSNEKTKNVYLRVTDFDNYTINQDKLKYISDDLAEKLKNYKISIEDLYLSIAGTIGKVGIIPYELDKSFLTENAVKLTNLSNTINNKFLLNCFKTNFIQNLISNSITSSGQPKLAIFRIENFSIPLPPLEEQQEIVRILDEVLENENKVKELLELEERIDILEKSILNKAFKGELGTQNNSDEPAIELLKEIL